MQHATHYDIYTIVIHKRRWYNLYKLIDLYEAYGWDLYDKFDHAYDAFRLCLSDPEVVFSKIDITEDQKKHLLANINKKMAAAPQKIRTRFNLKCYTYEGIDAIRDSMLEAEK